MRSFVLGAVMFVAGCASSSSPQTCAEGASASCTCADGRRGAQRCEGGAYLACECEMLPPGGDVPRDPPRGERVPIPEMPRADAGPMLEVDFDAGAEADAGTAEEELACGPRFETCGGESVDIQSDPRHCGACDRPCRSDSAVCDEGACVLGATTPGALSPIDGGTEELDFSPSGPGTVEVLLRTLRGTAALEASGCEPVRLRAPLPSGVAAIERCVLRVCDSTPLTLRVTGTEGSLYTLTTYERPFCGEGC